MAALIENAQHKAERKAFELMVNGLVGKLTAKEDREARQKIYLNLIDKAEMFYHEENKEVFDKVREYFKNPENRWVKFINQVLDETNPGLCKKIYFKYGI